MTKRAKIAAEHRDAVQMAKGDPDAPCMGPRRCKACKKRPWIVEYNYHHPSQKKLWFQWEDKQDGNWHENPFMGPYNTKAGAENAMRHRLREMESKRKLGCFKKDVVPEMRVRNAMESEK